MRQFFIDILWGFGFIHFREVTEDVIEEARHALAMDEMFRAEMDRRAEKERKWRQDGGFRRLFEEINRLDEERIERNKTWDEILEKTRKEPFGNGV